jgi:hypothetical protein
MIHVDKVARAALTGTTLMTAFSYGASRHERKQFREPELLNKLLDRIPGSPPIPTKSPAGWLVHYGVGIIFTTVYDQLWQRNISKPTLANGLLLGTISGLVGIGGWMLTFTLHPRPPKTDYTGHYKQLLIAHMIFGVGAALGYNKMKKLS